MSGVSARSSLESLERTPREIDEAIRDRPDDELGTRPAEHAWSVREIVCHLRDVEELFQERFHTIVALDEPRILTFGASAADLASWRIADRDVHPLNPDRWAEDRQYRRHDTHEALAAFARRRGTVLTLLRSLAAAEWQRDGIHLGRGRLSLLEWVGSLVAHDANHVDQLRRALAGLP
jgi:uncharacterized damage-inducible protein DinB